MPAQCERLKDVLVNAAKKKARHKSEIAVLLLLLLAHTCVYTYASVFGRVKQINQHLSTDAYVPDEKSFSARKDDVYSSKKARRLHEDSFEQKTSLIPTSTDATILGTLQAQSTLLDKVHSSNQRLEEQNRRLANEVESMRASLQQIGDEQNTQKGKMTKESKKQAIAMTEKEVMAWGAGSLVEVGKERKEREADMKSIESDETEKEIAVKAKDLSDTDGEASFCSWCLYKPSKTEGTTPMTCHERMRYYVRKYGHTNEKAKAIVMRVDPSNCRKNVSLEEEKHDICFVTSVYGPDADSVDRPPSVVDHRLEHPSVKFFVFTNIQDLDAPGWEPLIQYEEGKYKRFITYSRWGKFMAWRHERIQHCTVVFYEDGFTRPKMHDSFMTDWTQRASQILSSDVGLMQDKHKRRLGEEMKKIVEVKKDTREHVDKLKKWFEREEQGKYDKDIVLYTCTYFGYDPKSESYQKVATMFWDHYSKESDTWRDQPLWGYVLNKLQMKPLQLGNHNHRYLFKGHWGRQGHNGHRYENEVNHEGNLTATK